MAGPGDCKDGRGKNYFPINISRLKKLQRCTRGHSYINHSIVGAKTVEVAMINKRVLIPDRIRNPEGRFSFIPHRFLLDGFLRSLSVPELLLYFFLSLASDKNGISYYGQPSICSHLHMEEPIYQQALKALMDKDLIAYDGRLFQVLSLPEKPVVLNRIAQEALKVLSNTIVKEVP